MSGGEQPLPIARYDYELPTELIAQTPVEPRDAARLLVVDRPTGSFQDRHFRDLPEFLSPGDLLVVNDTRVMPARLYARRSTGGTVEFLLLERKENDQWLAVAKPARRLRVTESLTLVDQHGELSPYSVTIIGKDGDTVQVWIPDSAAIDLLGAVPLPPYIRARLQDPERYQTVYSASVGSAAAPTAGLHFTHKLLEKCRAVGASITSVTLHVGLDTFQPIRTEDARQHRIHSEKIEVSAQAMADISRSRCSGGRVIAVGTTAVRTLESIGDHVARRETSAVSQSTELYITPGYQFQVVDAMVTNFHLPRTSLLLLVSAFAGDDLVRRAYNHAIAQRYRFYSFGDAMLIV